LKRLIVVVTYRFGHAAGVAAAMTAGESAAMAAPQGAATSNAAAVRTSKTARFCIMGWLSLSWTRQRRV
jgi:hypothetical protein